MIIAGIDVFSGAGGLSWGLQKSGIRMVAGVDLDEACRYPFTANIKGTFLQRNVQELKGSELKRYFPKRCIRLLAGCAPCRPFSKYRCGQQPDQHEDWGLLGEFSRLVREIQPEFVTMENVPDLAHSSIFREFVNSLMRMKYFINYRVVYCPPLGIPQHRKRLVLLASSIGEIEVPKGFLKPIEFKTVAHTIGNLPQLMAGEVSPKDRLHIARNCTPKNLERLKASKPGGSWNDWPTHLRAACHRRKSGSTFPSVYSRMKWDEPSPTITTQAFNFGTGRFGHPDQNRSLSLRECAMLQTFPKSYQFVERDKPVRFETIGRLVGNAVPPRLAYFIGKEILKVVNSSK